MNGVWSQTSCFLVYNRSSSTPWSGPHLLPIILPEDHVTLFVTLALANDRVRAVQTGERPGVFHLLYMVVASVSSNGAAGGATTDKENKSISGGALNTPSCHLQEDDTRGNYTEVLRIYGQMMAVEWEGGSDTCHNKSVVKSRSVINRIHWQDIWNWWMD